MKSANLMPEASRFEPALGFPDDPHAAPFGDARPDDGKARRATGARVAFVDRIIADAATRGDVNGGAPTRGLGPKA